MLKKKNLIFFFVKGIHQKIFLEDGVEFRQSALPTTTRHIPNL